MSSGPYDQSPYAQSPFEQRPSEQPPAQRPADAMWEQPTFTQREPEPAVWGQVLVPVESRLVVAPPTAQEQQLWTLRRLIFPIALVIAVITGHWVPVLVLALVISGILRRQLAMSRRQRLQVAPTLR
jgi:hypothetical protein